MIVLDFIIKPLVFIYDLVFGIVYKICSSFSISDTVDYALPIIAVSIIVNILTFSLYKRADALQNEEREKQKEMAEGIDSIKKAFKGDERFFMLSTFYRQHNYKPIYALRCSLSLFLQIPFFTAAYQFFTSTNALVNQGGFYIGNGFIFTDLSKPDAMFTIGTLTINILPIIMTLINFISSAIYTKGFDMKDKIQPFILAIIFLVFLYNSPSGLVIYWTCNNIIALIKIIYFKIKGNKVETERNDEIENVEHKKFYNTVMIFSALSIGALMGLLIPTQIITSKPSDFVGWYSSFWPYIRYTFTTYVGLSLWILLFYFMSRQKTKIMISKVFFILCIVTIINYFCFYINFGFLSPLLRYDEKPVEFSFVYILSNIIVIAFICFVSIILIRKRHKVLCYLPTIVLFAFVVMSLFNIYLTKNQLEFKGKKAEYSSSTVLEQVDEEKIEEINEEVNNEKQDVIKDINLCTDNELFPVKPVFKLSKKGRNVILLMMDKYQGAYFPYMLHEKPILKEQFKGFTYYPNTVSFGCTTIYGTPGIFGGYEYTPIEHDKRNDGKLIKENQNEALKVLPTMFHREGFDCVVSNVPLENYSEKTRSIYDYDDTKDFIATKSNLVGKTMSKSVLQNIDNSMNGLKRNFIYYALMKCSPIFLQKNIYDGGRYLSAEAKNTMLYDMGFLGSFAVLERLCDYTKIVDDDSDNFFMMDNGAVHQPNMLSYPDFTPKPYTDNIADKEFYDDNGNKFEGPLTYFTSTMGATLQVGKFLDYLRENDVYDNTRIIIVADHGYPSDSWEKYLIKKNIKFRNNIKNIDLNGKNNNNFISINDDNVIFTILGLNPILLVKDFNSNDDILISNEFMTNADTPTLCISNLLKNKTNPFTNKKISSEYKITNLIMPTLGHHYNWEFRREDITYQYEDELWAIVYGDIYNKDYWNITYDIE